MIRMLDIKGVLNDGCQMLKKTLSDLEDLDDNLEISEYFVVIKLQQFMIEIRFNIMDF